MIIWGRPLLVDLPQLLDAIKMEAAVKGKGDYFQKTTNSSNDIFVICPRYDLHNGPEHTPSCSISKEEGLVHCFGCGYSTTVPGMVAHIFGLDNPVDGYKWILRRFTSPARGTRPAMLGPMERSTKKVHIPDDILELYNYDHPYMFKRGLTGEVIDWFDIGFDTEQEALTIPVREVDGSLAFIKKRPIKRTKFAKYIIEEGAEKSEIIYGLFMIQRCFSKVDMIYLSEGEMDVLSWYCIDRYGAGLQGADLLEPQFKLLLKVARGKPICLAFDNDKAGHKCKFESARKLGPYFNLYELQYPKDQYFKDPNALLVAGRLETCNIIPFSDI